MARQRKTLRRDGRGRNINAPREANGRAQRVPQETILPETILRRVDLVGFEQHRNDRASFPLGVLQIKEVVTERQYQAGRRFEDIHGRWARLHGAKQHYAEGNGGMSELMAVPSGSSRGSDYDEDTIGKINSSYHAASRALDGATPRLLARAALDSVVLDLFMPPTWAIPRVFTALCSALDVLGDHFGLPAHMGKEEERAA